MKSWQLQKFGIENLHLVDQPEPEPGPEQVLVRTAAVSLNFRDQAIITGQYHDPVNLPLIPGSDLAGEVIAVGANVTSFQAGDRVVSMFKPLWLKGTPGADAQAGMLGSPLPGVLAEYVVFSQDAVLKYPEYLTPAQASTLPVAALTAWVALFENKPLQREETVLVQGSGGVSLFGLQLASAFGARVIATSRGDRKISLLKGLGASDVIDTTKYPLWETEVMTLTNGKGVDHILEVVGGQSLQHAINAAAIGGQIAIIGMIESNAATISMSSILSKLVCLEGIAVGSREHMQSLLSFLGDHPIQPVIDNIYKFTDLPLAVEQLIRGATGKVVLELRSV